MTANRVDLRRVEQSIWILVAAVAALVLACAAGFGFTVVWASFVGPGVTAALLAAGQWFYRVRRPEPRLAAALGATAQIVAFVAVGAPLSYLGASTGLPLQDALLTRIDLALGLDWRALLAVMNDMAAIHPALYAIYESLMPQTVVVLLALAWAGKFAELHRFVLAFIVTTLVIIAIAAVLPAQGVWGHEGLTARDYADIVPATRDLHLSTFMGLRDGSYRQLIATGAEGIITFPSLHSALAVLLAAALWPVPVLRWIGIVLNVAMLISIPVDGGHYFIDVLAGIAIAIFAMRAAQSLTGRAASYRAPQRACTADADMAAPSR